jgi:SOS-response transcriptional repressor LexA
MNDPVSAYYWLKRGGDDFLYTIHNLLTGMHAGVEAGNYSTALEYLEQLENACRGADRLTQAKIHLECSLAACQMHDPSLAIGELEKALDLMGPGAGQSRHFAHTYAVTNWILGSLTMPVTGAASTAATAWQQSMQAFEYLANQPEFAGLAENWYQDRREEMQQAIQSALAGQISGPGLRPARLQCGRLTSIEAFDELSISQFGLPGRPSNPPKNIHLQPSQEEFFLADRPYQLVCLRGTRNILAIDSATEHCALLVLKNWMNRAGIETGDYVVYRCQEQAENGDIVVVEMMKVNPTAVVYHLSRKKGAVIFKPQSTDGSFGTFEFGPDDVDHYHIYGVVQGVLKPSGPTPATPPNPPAAGEPQAAAEPIPVEDFMRFLPLYSEIPAGGPRVKPAFTGDFVELDRFVIDNEPYTILNLLRNGKLIKLRSGDLIVLRVSGNSMNDQRQANIQDGDYVLLLPQDSAQDGDLVAAEIRGVDDRATLKRYREQNGEIRLVPESTDLSFHEEKFNQIYEKDDLDLAGDDQPFYIRGIALAVFKPYPTRP